MVKGTFNKKGNVCVT